MQSIGIIDSHGLRHFYDNTEIFVISQYKTLMKNKRFKRHSLTKFLVGISQSPSSTQEWMTAIHDITAHYF
jgi:hypothetical protein